VTLALAFGTIGWGLIATGTIGHLLHPESLTESLRVHTRHAQASAKVLTLVEAALTAAIAVALLADWGALRVLSAAGGAALGAGFTIWVLRLWLSGSDLPCACSWSSAPTSRWSVLRAAAVMATALLLVPIDASPTVTATALLTGGAAGLALFLLPDALAWPEESIRLRDFARAESPQT